jgi:hypothetical protein
MSNHISILSMVSIVNNLVLYHFCTLRTLGCLLGSYATSIKNLPLHLCPVPESFFSFIFWLSSYGCYVCFVPILTSIVIIILFSVILRPSSRFLKTISVFGSFSIPFYCIVVASTISPTASPRGYMVLDQFLADSISGLFCKCIFFLFGILCSFSLVLFS